MRLAVVGHGESGKNVVSEWLKQHSDLKYCHSTSEAAASLLFDVFSLFDGSASPPRYADTAACHADRRNHRELWREVILAFNGKRKTRLYLSMANNGNDVFNGIRCPVELQACLDAKIVDKVVWVERDVPRDPSFKIPYRDSYYALDNRGSLDDLDASLTAMCLNLGIPVR